MKLKNPIGNEYILALPLLRIVTETWIKALENSEEYFSLPDRV